MESSNTCHTCLNIRELIMVGGFVFVFWLGGEDIFGFCIVFNAPEKQNKTGGRDCLNEGKKFSV